jgi:hypothetical protein
MSRISNSFPALNDDHKHKSEIHCKMYYLIKIRDIERGDFIKCMRAGETEIHDYMSNKNRKFVFFNHQ